MLRKRDPKIVPELPGDVREFLRVRVELRVRADLTVSVDSRVRMTKNLKKKWRKIGCLRVDIGGGPQKRR